MVDGGDSLTSLWATMQLITIIIKRETANSFDKKLSVCQGIRICTICNKTVRVKDEKHECGKKFCKICKEILPTSNFCYVQPIEPSKNSNRWERNFTVLLSTGG